MSAPPGPSDRARRIAAAMFVLSALGTVAFLAGYLFISQRADLGRDENEWLGACLGVAMGALCIGFVVLGKSAPGSHGEQEREPHRSSSEDRRTTQETITTGLSQLGLRQSRLLRRTLLTALGLLPLPFVFGLRDLGPRPEGRLRLDKWKAGDLLIDPTTGAALKVGDLDIGAMTTVLPPSALTSDLPVNAESSVIVIRLPPGVNRPLPGRADWAVDDLVAYSKICTHAGCPVGLYEQQTHNLLCPCHQSTFYVPDGCSVLFGPAARPLPQLPIYVDQAGYVRARTGFGQPLGPSFWERR